ncbi:MAG: hypothetical protein KUG78_01360 [Kangiellaceae bacterium]|nr:hypothetical protein [Kangiellaceae bacterium]
MKNKLNRWVSFTLVNFLVSINCMADQGITSATHEQFQGQVIFSSQPISFKKEIQSQFKKSFDVNSDIYGRVYLSKAINHHPMRDGGSQSQGKYEIRAFIDDKPVSVKWGVFDQVALSGRKGNEWTTFQFSPRPKDVSTSNARIVSEHFTQAVQGLPRGNHNIRFEFWGMQGQKRTAAPIAVGSFNLRLENGERLGSQQTLPKDTFSGANLSELKKEVRRALFGGVAKTREEMLAVSIRSDWLTDTYSNAPWGKYRKLTAIVLWADNNNDQLCNYTSYNFVQDHIQAEQWSALKFQSFCMACEEGKVECTN